MAVSKNSAESAFNTRSSVPKPHNIDHGLNQPRKRRGKRNLHESPNDHLATMRPLEKWPTIEEILTDRPLERPVDYYWRQEFNNLPPKTATDEWSTDFGFHRNMPNLKVDFLDPIPPPPAETNYPVVFLDPITPPPAETFAYRGSTVTNVFVGAMGGLLALILLANAKIARDKRNRRGSGPLNNDLPPSYSKCAPSSNNQFVSEEPPPYDNAISSVECGAMITSSNQSEDVSPGRRTELVFDNGRVVERLSVDLNSNNNETGGAGDGDVQEQSTRHGNVQEQSTRHADFEDRVMYIDETPKAVIVGISYDI